MIKVSNIERGCDGKTYANDCLAENAGVPEWIKGECS